MIRHGNIHVDGAALFYEETGEGEPVLLLHAHSVDRRMWDRQFLAFSKNYRVIRFDFRGYGRSDLPKPGVKFRHADDVIHLMDAFGISKAHLIGLSLGSMVAADVLALYPERVSSAVMASGIMYTEVDEAESIGIETDQPQSDDPTIDPVPYRRQWLQQLIATCGPYASEINDKLHQMVESWTVWQPRYETERPLAGPSLVRLLRQTDPDIPTLTVIGMADSEGSRRSSEAFIALRPSTGIVLLPDAGHFSCMETPEAFNREVLYFLSRTGINGYAAY